MRNIILVLFLMLFLCAGKMNSQEPNAELETIESSFLNWWTYYNNNINFSRDFIALDYDSKKISKENFFERLTSGKFIPIKLKSVSAKDIYKLFNLTKLVDENIRRTIKNEALIAYKNHQWIGKKMPQFGFKALDGTIYNNQNTKGKTVILKCWFIHCIPCVEEIPQLNELVKKYDGRDDILFLSIALDSKEDLTNFLAKKTFTYKAIPEQEVFIQKALNVKFYPTHMVIDKEGVVKKVTQDADNLIYFINNHIPASEESTKKLPPPPPPPAPMPSKTKK